MAESPEQQRRREIAEWLNEHAPEYAPAFESITFLMNARPRGHERLVCHAARDLLTGLDSAIDQAAKNKPSKSLDPVSELLRAWTDTGALPTANEPVSTSAVPQAVLTLLVKLLEQRAVNDKLPKPTHRFASKLHERSLVSAPLTQSFGDTGWALRQWFVGRAHFASQAITPAEDDLRSHVDQLEAWLHSAVGAFFSILDTVEPLVASTNVPTPADVAQLTAVMGSSAIEHAILQKLGPQWISPLTDAGFFSAKAIANREGGEGSGGRRMLYLMRMAQQHRDSSSAVASAVLASVGKSQRCYNRYLASDVLRICANLEPGDGLRLLPAIENSTDQLQAFTFGLLTPVLNAWVKHQPASAERLLKISDNVLFPSVKAKLKRQSDDHWTITTVEKLADAFMEHAPKLFVDFLLRWLNNAVYRDRYGYGQVSINHSTSWCHAIDSGRQESVTDDRFGLLVLLRSHLEQTITDDSLSISEAIELLEKLNPTIFQRLQLHLLTKFGSSVPDRVRNALMDERYFDDREYEPEYARLADRQFHILGDADRSVWFARIDAVPDYFLELHKRKGWTLAMQDDAIESWQHQRLRWVERHLEGDRLRQYDKLNQKYGRPELFFDTSARRVYPVSPFSLADLDPLPLSDLIGKIAAWTAPERDRSSPAVSLDELRTVVKELFKKRIPEFASRAETLIGAPAWVVDAFLHGAEQALKAGTAFDHVAVLRLAAWASIQQDPPPPPPNPGDSWRTIGPWESCRYVLSRFADEACGGNGAVGISYSEDARASLRAIIDALRAVPPTRWRGNVNKDVPWHLQDWYGDAINSHEGRTMEAVISYAYWVARMHQNETLKRTERGFDHVPEARAWLEGALNRQTRSPEEMAMIGSKIAHLYAIDLEWLQANVDQIFDLQTIGDTEEGAASWAAWNAFLLTSQIHPDLLKLLTRSFASACDQMKNVDRQHHASYEDAVARLGTYLMALFPWGHVDLEAGGLLDQYIQNAPPDARRHMISEAHHTFDQAGDDIDDEIVRRYKALWTRYWHDGPGKADYAEHNQSWGFAHWFGSGVFDAEWSLKELRSFCEVVGVPEPDHLVLPRLAEIASTSPEDSMAILASIVEKTTDGLYIGDEEREHYKTILRIARNAKGDAAKLATKIINKLGERGHSEFGDLRKEGQ